MKPEVMAGVQVSSVPGSDAISSVILTCQKSDANKDLVIGLARENPLDTPVKKMV